MERITEPEIKIGVFGWRLPCHAFVFARWDEQSVFLSFLFVSSFTVSVLTIWQSTCIASQPTASFFWHCVTRANPVFSRVSAIQRFFFSWCFRVPIQDDRTTERRVAWTSMCLRTIAFLLPFSLVLFRLVLQRIAKST